jgi:glutathione S-transferase
VIIREALERRHMIKLHQFPAHYGLPNASPFCMKVENYLRLAGIPYEVVDDFDMRKTPKGKMPYIEDAGRAIGDSDLIIAYLKSTYGDPLDAHLSTQARAASLGFIRMLDEHLYWAAIIQPRWVEPAGWAVTRAHFFGGLRGMMALLVPHVARYNLKKQIWHHGMGRHSRDEIDAKARADISALGDYLGEQPFFHGDRPTTLDAVAYAYLANIIHAPFDTPAQVHARGLPNLVAYCDRMRERCYGGP